MNEIVSSARLQRLLNINSAALSTLAAEGVAVRGTKRGTYALEASVRGYVARLQASARGRGGADNAEARARLAEAQTALTETKARQLSGELVEAVEVEALWTRKLRAFRNRVLAVPSRVKALSKRQSASMAAELRAALDELADDEKPTRSAA